MSEHDEAEITQMGLCIPMGISLDSLIEELQRFRSYLDRGDMRFTLVKFGWYDGSTWLDFFQMEEMEIRWPELVEKGQRSIIMMFNVEPPQVE